VIYGFSREENSSKREKVLLLLQHYEDTGVGCYSAQQKKLLCNWFRAHIMHPYPSNAQKLELVEECDLSYVQVSKWFERMRYNIWTPVMVWNFPR